MTYRSNKDPDVIIYAQHGDHAAMLDIVVRNIGGSLAYNISLKPDKELFGDKMPENIGKRNNKGLFLSGIPFLSPDGYRRMYWVANKHEAWFNFTDWVCKVTVSFERKTWFGNLKQCDEGVYPIELDSFVESHNDDNTDLMRCMRNISTSEVRTSRGIEESSLAIQRIESMVSDFIISAFYAMKGDVSNTYGEDEYVDASAGNKNSEGNFAHINPSFLDNQTIGEMSQGELSNQLDRKQHFYQSNGEME